MSFRFIHLH